jgi:hypothetical protein
MNALAAMPEPRSGERLTLADGADVKIRPLGHSDRAALASAVARLSRALPGSPRYPGGLLLSGGRTRDSKETTFLGDVAGERGACQGPSAEPR